MNPRTLPQITIEIEGAPVSSNDARTLSEMRVQQRLSLPTLCELTFVDPRGPLAGASLSPGASLRILMEGHPEPLFIGEVTAVDYGYGPAQGREIRVRGYDRLHRLRKRQPVRAHVQLTLVELARELTADLGLKVEATEPGPLWQKLVQYWQSDLELMTEVAERCGLYFSLRGDSLHFLTLAGGGEPIPLTLGSSLLEAHIEINADPACQSVTASGWDPWRAEHHQGRAGKARVGRRVAAHVGSTDEHILTDQAVQDDRQAEAIAQAELDRCVAREVTMWGIAEGNPRLCPGALVEVDGVAAPLTGRYVLTAVNHVLDRHKGFVSEINTLPPTPQTRPRGTLATLGTVTQVDDPDGLGRIRVSLPNYQDIETDWLEVVIPGAGPGKGIVALPDVGDQVLVLFLHEDPAQAVILGGLYGVQGPLDSGVEDGAVRRYNFLTPGGQRIQLDDEKKTARIENQDGNYLRLSPGRVKLGNRDGSYLELSPKSLMIHAEVGLEIEAPGQSVTIRGQTIDFERV